MIKEAALCFDYSAMRDSVKMRAMVGVIENGLEICLIMSFIYIRKSVFSSTTILIIRFRIICKGWCEPNGGSLARRFWCQTWSNAFEVSRATARVSISVITALF